MGPDSAAPIAVEGRNCWRRPRARRVAFLVDGEAYFAAFAATALRARRSILIVGWDFDSRVQLRPAGGPPQVTPGLGPFLNGLVAARPELRVRLLSWDFSIIYTFERQALPVLRLDWLTHRGLRFRLDGAHPPAGSHHQKIVVVDDAVAFSGGLDLCVRRWDTPAHEPHSPHRVDPGGDPYGPFHDVQMAVDGEAAAALGDLARERWRRATGQSAAAPEEKGGPDEPASFDPWPPALVPDLTDVDVAIARTDAAWDGRPAVREVEALFLDAIAAARRCIFLEHQFFTCERIAEALAARLAEPDGPEVVIIAPHEASGWLERGTMSVLRARQLERLRASDPHGRFRVYAPMLAPPARFPVNVHDKVMVVDDALARIGSANLTNRSMGLDSECDLAIDALGEARVAAAIAGLRDRLLAEHLGVPAGRLAEAGAACGSVGGAIETLRRADGRTLEPLAGAVPEWLHKLVPDAGLVDPGAALHVGVVLDRIVPGDVRESSRGALVRGALTVAALGAIGATWAFTPIGRDLGAVALGSWAEPLRASGLAPLVVPAAFVVGALMMVPVVLLIVAVALAFPEGEAVLLCAAGSLAATAAGYWIGRLLAPRALLRLAERRFPRLARRLARPGPWAMAAARLLPVAPFTLVNLVAGAQRRSFGELVAGTAIGMAPGILLLTFYGRRMAAALQDPGPVSVALLVLLVALVAGAGWLFDRLGRARRPPQAVAASG